MTRTTRPVTASAPSSARDLAFSSPRRTPVSTSTTAAYRLVPPRSTPTASSRSACICCLPTLPLATAVAPVSRYVHGCDMPALRTNTHIGGRQGPHLVLRRDLLHGPSCATLTSIIIARPAVMVNRSAQGSAVIEHSRIVPEAVRQALAARGRAGTAHCTQAVRTLSHGAGSGAYEQGMRQTLIVGRSQTPATGRLVGSIVMHGHWHWTERAHGFTIASPSRRRERRVQHGQRCQLPA